MKRTLMYDISRCAGRYQFGDGLDDDPSNWCPERDTCARYKAFTVWDRQAGLPDYQQIAVSMALPDCGHKIEVKDG